MHVIEKLGLIAAFKGGFFGLILSSLCLSFGFNSDYFTPFVFVKIIGVISLGLAAIGFIYFHLSRLFLNSDDKKTRGGRGDNINSNDPANTYSSSNSSCGGD